MKTPKGFFTYFHHAEALDNLTDARAGRVYKALLHYGEEGVLPDFSDDPVCQFAFTVMRVEIDRNFERYNEVCEKRKKAAQTRWSDSHPSSDNDDTYPT